MEEAAILLGEVLSRSRCHYAVSAFLNNPVAESVVRSLGFRSLPHMGLKVTVRPLGDESRTFVRGDDWVLSTGDLQVF